MAVIMEQHLAVMVGPVRIAATGAMAAHDTRRAFEALPDALEPISTRQLEWSRFWSEGAAAGLQESLRRTRENRRPDLGEPNVPWVLSEVLASIAEMYAALRVARREISGAALTKVAEPVTGRYGELAAQVADWGTTASDVQRLVGEQPLRAGVQWGPDPADPRVGAPVALALATCFGISTALGAMAVVDDNRVAGGVDHVVQPVFEIAPQALWSATELASSAAICLEHSVTIGHAWPDDPLEPVARCVESLRRHRDSVALQVEDLDRYQPADASAARPGYVFMLERLEEDLRILSDHADGGI